MKHQHGRESAGMIFITRFMNSFLHQASFATGYWYYDRHRSVRLVILVGLAIDQIAQSGLSSLSVIYYSAQLFSAVLGSGSYNENKSSKHMELLAHSIVKLICKEAASETYRGALEILQKIMSECIYHEGNAFVIMGAGEQLKRIKYEVGENNLKVFNVHFNNNHELVSSGEPDVICLSKQVWENLLIKLKLENNENVFSETKKLSNKNNADQFFECAKRNE